MGDCFIVNECEMSFSNMCGVPALSWSSHALSEFLTPFGLGDFGGGADGRQASNSAVAGDCPRPRPPPLCFGRAQAKLGHGPELSPLSASIESEIS